MKIYIIFFFVLVVNINTNYAQGIQEKKQKNTNTAARSIQIKQLKVGDKIPDVKLTILKKGLISTKNFYDFKQPLVILDFWDTSCKSCIEAMPKLDTLQGLFGDKILILPVTFQDQNLIKTFLNGNRFLQKNNVKLPSVVNDKLLAQYFKHRGVPHEVWLHKGVVKAITGADYIDENNIQRILREEKINWPIKDDYLSYDFKNKPLVTFERTRLTETNLQKYAIVTGYLNGIPRNAGSVRDTLNKVIRDYNFNCPILLSYQYALSMGRKDPFFIVPNRIILQVKDTDKYIFNPQKHYYNEWIEKYSICFESLLPDTSSVSVRSKMMVDQLNRLLGVNGRFENRSMPCLVIKRLKNKSIVSADTNAKYPIMLNSLIKQLDVSNLNNGQFPPILDETNYKGEISIGEWNDLESLRKQLSSVGFEIVSDKRVVKTFVLSEDDYFKRPLEN